MENLKPNSLNDGDIRIYRDFYSDPSYVLVGYKGKTVDAPGIFFIPYKKPNILVRLFGKIKGLFRKPSEAVALHTDSDGRTLYVSAKGCQR